jgi:hypothetical protein
MRSARTLQNLSKELSRELSVAFVNGDACQQLPLDRQELVNMGSARGFINQANCLGREPSDS